jgi:molecular chaperone HtpG
MKSTTNKYSISLPDVYASKVKGTIYEVKINTIIQLLEPLYRDNRMFFFEEYTDHSNEHIQEVINASVELIPNSCINALDAINIFALISSIILHDIGMQLSLDGFKKIISGDLDEFIINEFDNRTWKEEWESFLRKAKKFDEKTIKNVFGEDIGPDFIVPQPNAKTLSYNNITGAEKKLIGEFIRRHHARLAHEVAVGFFPGASNTVLFEGITPSIAGLIGLIGRSHNLPVRKTFDYLKKRSRATWYSLYDIHAVYLMILLRLSDLIQIHSQRADSSKLKFRSLSSPMSTSEWRTHQAIISVSNYSADPEAIDITCEPLDSSIFLKLKSLFEYIQYELDISWAILGEVYASNPRLNNLSITYRRITSNIDNDNEFDAPYLPRKITFAPSTDLQNLLIAPLYGNNPSYGIRELIQNAVDACKTRAYLEAHNGGNYSPTIKISITKDALGSLYTFKITDNGIGMDEDILIDYFLKAGSSFRKSSAWQKSFMDEDGKTYVQRAGRFGIGVLATFLLGAKINVSTRHIDKQDGVGLKFSATINAEQIDVLKCSLPIGTSIEILMNERVSLELKNQLYQGYMYHHYANSNFKNFWYKWFRFNSPHIDITVPNGWPPVPKILFSPDEEEELEPEFHSFKPEGYNKVVWGYESKIYLTDDATDINKRLPKVLCNGIDIPNGYSLSDNYSSISNEPSISVFDYDGIFPLTLDRNSLDQATLPFEELLALEIYKDIIAYALAAEYPSFKENSISTAKSLVNHPSFLDTSVYKEIYSRLNLIFNKNGFTFLQPHCLVKANIGSIVEIWSGITNKSYIDIIPGDSWYLYYLSKLNSIGDFKSAFQRLFYNHAPNPENDTLARLVKPKSKLLMVRTDSYAYITETDKKRIQNYFRETMSIISENKTWTLLYNSNYNTANDLSNINVLQHINPSTLAEDKNTSAFIITLIDSFYKPSSYEDKVLHPLMKRYLTDDAIIPYNFEERKKKFPKAFSELKDKIEKHRKRMRMRDA